jgi:hypothetical protein
MVFAGDLISTTTSRVSSAIIAKHSLLTLVSYNSAVFGSISTNSYYAFSVGESFTKDEQCTNCSEISKEAISIKNYGRPAYSVDAVEFHQHSKASGVKRVRTTSKNSTTLNAATSMLLVYSPIE